jgi:hypothetical protein
MARVYLVSNHSRLKLSYTVDAAVGPGCPNRRDDVLLVQFLLRVAMEDIPGRPGSGYRPPGQAPIAIDGLYGPMTLAYIQYFEEEGNRRNPTNQVTTDHRIDPVVGGQPGGSLSQRLYKILALNLLYLDRRSLAVHADIKTDPLCPAELVTSLYISA